jgi:hypothetical protein
MVNVATLEVPDPQGEVPEIIHWYLFPAIAKVMEYSV